MDIREIRRRNFTCIIKELEESREEFAARVGLPNANYVAQILGDFKGIGPVIAERIETQMELKEGWLSEKNLEVWRKHDLDTDIRDIDYSDMSLQEISEALRKISNTLILMTKNNKSVQRVAETLRKAANTLAKVAKKNK